MVIDSNVWHQGHEECNKICTIKSLNLSCSDNNTPVRAVFKFDINLPRNVYIIGFCKSCFNVTQIDITCTLDIRSVKSEPLSTHNEEITTSKMISKSSGKWFLSLFTYLVSLLRKK